MGLCLCIGACACLLGSAVATYTCIRELEEENQRCNGNCASQK